MDFIGRLVALCDSKESKARSKARAMMQNKYFLSSDEALEIDTRIHNDIHNYGICDWKYVIGVARMVASRVGVGDIDTTGLDRSLGILGSDPEVAAQFDENLNGLSVDQFIEKMQPYVAHQLEADKQRSASQQRQVNSRYTIVSVPTFEDCTKYHKYTDWCVTWSKPNYDHYTHGGSGNFYFCLRDDYKTVRKVDGPDAPLDDYGLSMIAVSVNADSSLNTATSRWNHDHGSHDHMFSVEQLEDILGVSFYETFKPIHNLNGILAEINSKIAAGERDLDKLFGENNCGRPYEGICVVRVANLYNHFRLDNYTFVSERWWSEVGYFSEGFAMVSNNEGKCNYISADGDILMDHWYNGHCGDFSDGYAVVRSFSNILGQTRWNLVDTNGDLVFDSWIDVENYRVISVVMDGIIIVRNTRNSGVNFISIDRKDVLLPEHIESEIRDARPFFEGYCVVQSKDDKFNLMSTDGRFLFSDWMYYCGSFNNGIAPVTFEQYETNFIKADGNLLFSQNLRRIKSCRQGCYCIQRNSDDLWNWLNSETASIVCKSQWFKEVDDFAEDGYAEATTVGDNYVLVDKNGKVSYDEDMEPDTYATGVTY